MPPMIRTPIPVVAMMALTMTAPASRAANIGADDNRFAMRMLALHNQERAAVGVPPLAWDPGLAVSAASYGPTLAGMGRLAHSPREGRPGQRENLAMSSTGFYNDLQLAGLWVAEKNHYVHGPFPNVSRTGHWKDVAHYTQMVWKGTTHVGCALYRGGGNDFLICRYSPPGNKDGKTAY
jgi:hypothetical protein